MKITLKLAGTILLGLVFVIILGMVFINHLPISVSCLNCITENGISSRGSILLEFSKAVDPAMVEAAWNIDPFVSGNWEWTDNQHASWRADPYLQPEDTYMVSIKGSNIGANGTDVVKDTSWSITIRSPKILFLQNSQSGQDIAENDDYKSQDIFLIESGIDSEITQLTFTTGDIYDYAPSPDGEFIVFTLTNTQGGRDLWIINRDGADMHKILNCESQLCSSAVVSPDGRRIAFVREQSDPFSEHTILPVIWVLDLESSQAAPLLDDLSVLGSSPTWSMDGEWLSFWDSSSERIYIVNLQTGDILMIKSIPGESGCWSATTDSLYYLKMDFIEATFFNVIQQADIENNTLETIVDWDGSGSYTSYENLTCHPSSDWIGLTIQRNIKIPGKEIAIIDPGTKDILTISSDMTKVPAFLSWSPTGSHLMYQLGTFSQNFKNAVYIWDAENNSSSLILENVYAPTWLP